MSGTNFSKDELLWLIRLDVWFVCFPYCTCHKFSNLLPSFLQVRPRWMICVWYKLITPSPPSPPPPKFWGVIVYFGVFTLVSTRNWKKLLKFSLRDRNCSAQSFRACLKHFSKFAAWSKPRLRSGCVIEHWPSGRLWSREVVSPAFS